MKKLALLLLALVASNCRCDDPASNSFPTIDVGPDTAQPAADAGNDATPDAGGIACGSDGEDRFEVAGWTITLSHHDGSWLAVADDAPTTMLRGPAVCDGQRAIALLDEEPVTRWAFGNFQIDLTGDAEWEADDGRVPTAVATSNGAELTYRTANHLATLRFAEGDAGGLSIQLVHDVQSAEFRFAADADTSFFGLGTQAPGMDLRGRNFPLWTQEQGNGKPEGGGNFPLNNLPEAAYAPMGVLHSTAGWSAVVTHDGYTEVDLAHADPGFVAIRSHLANPGFVFLTGTPRERMTAVTEYVGRVRDDIPDWAFGLWVDSVTGPQRLDTVTTTLRTEQIPASAIWSEDWIGGESSTFGFRLSYDWVYDPTLYPDLPMLVDDLHTRGFAFLGYFNTFIPQPTSIWAEAQAGGYFVNDADGMPIEFQDPAFRNAGLVDLFNPAAADWLRGYQLTAVTDIGLDGWMADFSEWYPLEAPDVWERHNLFALQWQRVNEANMREARPDGNYVYFPRSGWASVNGGTGGVAPVMWGGDQNTDWGYDDGFPTIIPIAANVGLSGVPIFGSDIAGYNSVGPSPNTTKELWFRWAATAAFHPLMRTHHGGDECNNWNFDRDAETLAHLGRWSRIHSLLLPEFRRLYIEAQTTGWPISRHPWLVEPDNAALWTGDQYGWFLGDDIWIAPVLTEGATTRDVTLPAMGWWPLFGDAPIAQTTTTADVPVTEVPAYIRPGRALVLLAAPPDSFYGASDGTTTDLDDVADAYRVALYPDAAGAATTPDDSPFTITGSGLAQFSASGATLDATLLPNCIAPITSSCVDGDLIRLVGVTDGTLTAGGATIDVDATTPVSVIIGIAGDAWGELATPTSYAPNPDAPSWCP